jgi:hypothetical protein
MAQKLGGASAPEISILRIALALGICLVAGIGLILYMRRGGVRPAFLAGWGEGLARKRRIEVIEARRLSVHADLCLARCDGIEYLLVCSSTGLTVLERSPLGIDPSYAGAEA